MFEGKQSFFSFERLNISGDLESVCARDLNLLLYPNTHVYALLPVGIYGFGTKIYDRLIVPGESRRTNNQSAR